jgi:hypothetical protein
MYGHRLRGQRGFDDDDLTLPDGEDDPAAE